MAVVSLKSVSLVGSTISSKSTINVKAVTSVYTAQTDRPFKSDFFGLIKFCAELCTKIAIKTCKI